MNFINNQKKIKINTPMEFNSMGYIISSFFIR
nr:MAG TPA: hypothetical protein [Caudoviricetes sp.]